MMAFFGLFFTIYTPIGIKTKVRRQMKASQSLSDPVKYTVTENKITLSQGDIHEELLWEEVYKLKATPKCVILYLSAVRANVIPFKCLGDKAESFVMIAEKKLSPNLVSYFQVFLCSNANIQKTHKNFCGRSINHRTCITFVYLNSCRTLPKCNEVSGGKCD